MVLAAHLAGGQDSELIPGEVSEISSVELSEDTQVRSAGGHLGMAKEQALTFILTLHS